MSPMRTNKQTNKQTTRKHRATQLLICEKLSLAIKHPLGTNFDFSFGQGFLRIDYSHGQWEKRPEICWGDVWATFLQIFNGEHINTHHIEPKSHFCNIWPPPAFSPSWPISLEEKSPKKTTDLNRNSATCFRILWTRPSLEDSIFPEKKLVLGKLSQLRWM